MRIKRFAASGVLLATGALVLSACTPTTAPGAEIVEGTSITAAWSQPFYSANGNTSFGNATANNNINYMTYSGFNFYDNTPELQQDTSFGSYELVSEDPLQVQYTINEGVQWSDEVPVDAADMLLNWAAISGAFNTEDFAPEEYQDPETGEFTTEFPEGTVFFDSGATPTSGLGLVQETPEINEDGRGILMTYSDFYVDWELAFGAGLPAHVIAMNALGIEDPTEAKQAVIDAIQNEDMGVIAQLASYWNTGFNFTEMPSDTSVLTANGPYIISDFVADQYITLQANENYVGDHQPQVETITVRFITDAMAAVTALQNGDVDIIQPQATPDVRAALEGTEGITVNYGEGATYEHVDLQFDQSKNPGVFETLEARQSFLLTIPRQEIIDRLIIPLNPEATVRNSAVFVPGAEGYDESVENSGILDMYSEVDIEQATALREQAGLEEGTEVCLLFASTNPRRVSEFELIRESAAEAGWTVTDCSSPEWGGLLGAPGAYDASLFGWQSTSLGVASVGPNFETGGINNLSYYSNEEMDAVVQELNTTVDTERQMELLMEIDRILVEDAFGITIFQFPEVTAFSDRITGIDSSPLAPTIFWNVWDWTPTETNASEG
ncbi:ABC transporter family substrate-binding protein [Agrococcus sp. BE272]|uniref:ABC transporter family substrate-binding protein n=1 Tax=Agrococcus sp. BE272 TaxID=2817727 RepID=UPI0028555D70|nr:ABC transporter family substrate-binding protein [Agrococcus sp. BE272]MDR7234217.1 peptide/nickel transport system substrate-binding protein [Agrococcus sp. BE272]